MICRELVPSICRKQTCVNSSIKQHQVQTLEHIWTCSLSLKIRVCSSASVQSDREETNSADHNLSLTLTPANPLAKHAAVGYFICLHYLWDLGWETALASFWWNCHCSYFTFKSILTSLKKSKIFQELKKIWPRGKSKYFICLPASIFYVIVIGVPTHSETAPAYS